MGRLDSRVDREILKGVWVDERMDQDGIVFGKAWDDYSVRW